MPFNIVRNDITKMKVDAVVNTANPEVTIIPGFKLPAKYIIHGSMHILWVKKEISK